MKHLVLLVTLVALSGAAPRLMGSLYKHHTPTKNAFKTTSVHQILDHFALDPVGSEQKFDQRILFNVDHWNPATGCIFFYTGNEGAIELFAQNTGLLWDLAPEFGAAIVFAEHRYYGYSMPFGSVNASFADPAHSRYMTVEQAMADFADNIVWVRRNLLGKLDAPVITFGGSYGGMLAAWMRAKYPSLVQGAIAASAPVWMFPGQPESSLLGPAGPYIVLTEAYGLADRECPSRVSKSWSLIASMATTDSGLAKLQDLFHLCHPLTTDTAHLLSDWLNEMYFDMAMVNYPYPTSFLAPLPAWPVAKFCAASNTTDTLSGIAAGAQVYANHTGKVPCLDLDKDPAGDLGMTGWDYQSCTEMFLPISSDPKQDMFPESTFNLAEMVKYCEGKWGVSARPYHLKHYFGGMDGYDFSGYSNIFFSNGRLDPWAAGGTAILASEPFCLSDCPNPLIKDGAHHLDLRSANPADPESVLRVRKMEKEAIQRWVNQGRNIRV